MTVNAQQASAPEAEVREDSAVIADERRRATRAVASAARNAADCAMLLDALGLAPEEGRPDLPTQRVGS
jgi:hypothetical protein